MWGSNGSEWVYMGNQYVMKELFTLKQCEQIISSDNWKKHETNEYYKIQLDCKKKEE